MKRKESKKEKFNLLNLLTRYTILLLAPLNSLFIFYFILTPLTLYPVYFLFNLFFDVSLIKNLLQVNGITIELIEACIAGSAYYLLLILNLSTPDIKTLKRIKMILLAFLTLLIINIIRIFVLGAMYLQGNLWFDFTHALFWYSLSIFFVILIWFGQVKIFKIKEMPFYSDMKYLYKKSKIPKQ